MSFANLLVGVSIMLFILTTIQALRKKVKYANYFIIAFLFIVVGTVILILKNLGIFTLISGETALKLGSALEIITLFWALTVRFNDMLAESKNKAIEHLTQLNKLKEDNNIILEKKVKIRTVELEQANRDILTKSEKISAQNKQLGNQKEELITSLDKNKHLQEILKKKLDQTTQEVLCKQMNPHFIFNTLNSIQYFIMKNDAENSEVYLTKFAKLMRINLSNSQHQSIPIKDELTALELYLELEVLRFNNQFTYEIVIDNMLDIESFRIPTLLIQPYVENAILHGLRHKEDQGKITIRLETLDDDTLVCTIQDDGIGRKKSAELKRT